MADPTRDAAFDLISAVFDRHSSLDAALGRLPPGTAPRDRAAAHRIAASVFRHAGSIDAILDHHLRRAPPQAVRHILRIGTAQVVFLETSAHAAVGTSVELAKTRKLAPFAGLINAVLRRIAAEGKNVVSTLDLPRLDTPPWLWASWGIRARDIAIANGKEAPLDLSLMPGAQPPPGANVLPTGTVRLPTGTDVTALPGFARGDFWVQDAAASLPARTLGNVRGRRVLDLCAAPGGKTAQLAAAGAHVTAVDRDGDRVRRLQENLQRLKLSAEIVVNDAVTYRPAEKFPFILLDAPCSATGTIRRHPEILLRRRQDISACVKQQNRLLDAALTMLAPGGLLAYAVCSLQSPEGEGVIDAALDRHALMIDPIDVSIMPGLAGAISPRGLLQTDPSMWADQGGIDGFFVARLRRTHSA